MQQHMTEILLSENISQTHNYRYQLYKRNVKTKLPGHTNAVRLDTEQKDVTSGREKDKGR